MANVLLVDDDPENLWSLQVALEGDGHHVSVAGDARRAMDLLHRERVEFLITDYEMPDIDGAQLCRWVRAQPAHHDMPIMMLSAAPEPSGAPRWWTRFLRKPASIDQLTDAINAHVAVRLTTEARPRCHASRYALLKCQYPAVSRWAAVNADCWP
ncbi:response regulator [Paraburkholderia sp. MPAMCS5]|uniref:response regulator n=1 Tax=Paraburkholderia sp. MPAMCS5 TaxID=3112563 RepID=UPI002E17D6A8|nr:response regulator [Paraburkholderia sp. MPAMCS5]